jgi:hypothetical protein
MPFRMFRRLHWAHLAVPFAGVACGDLVCTSQPRPAIRAEVRDSVTNAPSGFGASLIVTNTAVYDSSMSPQGFTDTSAVSSLESAPNGVGGVYAVRVRKIGYRLWQQTGVVVNGDRCGADAVSLQVRLQPGP